MIERAQSTLWVIDVQARLLAQEHEWQAMLDGCLWLVNLAKRLGVPVIASEQYPKGVGPTHDALAAALAQAPASPVVAKQQFSCVAANCFADVPEAARRQAILCGMEAHVCVLQTALDLRAQGREVFVVADAVTARAESDIQLALARLRDAGVHIVSREMVGFEWLRAAGTPEFKDFSINFLR